MDKLRSLTYIFEKLSLINAENIKLHPVLLNLRKPFARDRCSLLPIGIIKISSQNLLVVGRNAIFRVSFVGSVFYA